MTLNENEKELQAGTHNEGPKWAAVAIVVVVAATTVESINHCGPSSDRIPLGARWLPERHLFVPFRRVFSSHKTTLRVSHGDAGRRLSSVILFSTVSLFSGPNDDQHNHRQQNMRVP